MGRKRIYKFYGTYIGPPGFLNLPGFGRITPGKEIEISKKLAQALSKSVKWTTRTGYEYMIEPEPVPQKIVFKPKKIKTEIVLEAGVIGVTSDMEAEMDSQKKENFEETEPELESEINNEEENGSK